MVGRVGPHTVYSSFFQRGGFAVLECGWFLAGSLWLLGGIGLLMCEATNGWKYRFWGVVGIIACWPLIILLSIVIYSFQGITSTRVR